MSGGRSRAGGPQKNPGATGKKIGRQALRAGRKRMNKPVLGLIVGGVLGVFDGLSALLSAPEVAPQIVGIVIGSTLKGVIVGLIVGFFARKVRSLPLGIAVGIGVGLLFAYLVAAQPDPATGRHYYWEIMLPGSLAGAIVGYATQRYGRRPGSAAA
jgi:hypothetical protein